MTHGHELRGGMIVGRKGVRRRGGTMEERIGTTVIA